MADSYSGARVLITGGTGSFGRSMVSHLLGRDVGQIRVLSRDETKQHEMRLALSDRRLEFQLGDVRDATSVRSAVSGADLVLHAAALKQVPSCELFPMQAVMTNVLGTDNLLRAASELGVASVVCLSTDKAVAPVNAMGMTKALMEKLVRASALAGPNTTTASAVRYGNVLYSRGSVVPTFVKQVFEGQDLTVTDPAMTRFLMPQADAVALVDFAFFHADPGDRFIRKSVAATVGDLASAVNILFGRSDRVVEIGVRPGEKLHETLATERELAFAEDIGDYLRLRLDTGDVHHEVGSRPRGTAQGYRSDNAERLGVEQICELFETLPEIKDSLDQWAQRH
jgi:UDP-glucose 4-epimerase